jgi:DNA-binding XRE family transcriptional regulator
MSAHTKKHLTDEVVEITWHNGLYAVPIDILERYKVKVDSSTIPVTELFSHLTQKSSESGVLLKGLRYREGLSQMQLAQKLNISQANLSAMENGRRNIGKELAKRIAEFFGLDYRIFL